MQIDLNGKDYFVVWAYLDLEKTQRFMEANRETLPSRVRRHMDDYRSMAICRFKVLNTEGKRDVEFEGYSFCRADEKRDDRRLARKFAFQHALENSNFDRKAKAKAWDLFLTLFPPTHSARNKAALSNLMKLRNENNELRALVERLSHKGLTDQAPPAVS